MYTLSEDIGHNEVDTKGERIILEVMVFLSNALNVSVNTRPTATVHVSIILLTNVLPSQNKGKPAQRRQGQEQRVNWD